MIHYVLFKKIPAYIWWRSCLQVNAFYALHIRQKTVLCTKLCQSGLSRSQTRCIFFLSTSSCSFLLNPLKHCYAINITEVQTTWLSLGYKWYMVLNLVQHPEWGSSFTKVLEIMLLALLVPWNLVMCLSWEKRTSLPRDTASISSSLLFSSCFWHILSRLI